MMSSTHQSTSNASTLLDAKEARKRAMERARSMHSRVRRPSKDDMDAGKADVIKSNSTSHCRRLAKESSFRRKPRGSSSVRRSGYNNRRSSLGNASIDSISELEAVITFDDNGSSASSLSQLTGSFNSLHSSFASSCVTQGPSVFESHSVEKVSSVAPRMPRRARSTRKLDCSALEDSNGSLNLEEIKENDKEDIAPSTPTTSRMSASARPDSNTTMGASNSSLTLEDIQEDTPQGHTAVPSSPTPSPSRQWSDARPRNAIGIHMPVRVSSIPELGVDMKEIGREWMEKQQLKNVDMRRPVRRASTEEIHGVDTKKKSHGNSVGGTGSQIVGTPAIPVRAGTTAQGNHESQSNSGSESTLSLLSLSQSGSTTTGISFFSQSNDPSIENNMTPGLCAV